MFSRGSASGSFHGSRHRTGSTLTVGSDDSDDKPLNLGRQLRALSSVDEGVESEAVSTWLHTHPALPFPYNRWGSEGSGGRGGSPTKRRGRATQPALPRVMSRTRGQLHHAASSPMMRVGDHTSVRGRRKHGSVFATNDGRSVPSVASPMAYQQNPLASRRRQNATPPVEEGDEEEEETVWEETVWEEEDEGQHRLRHQQQSF